ncbi:MAG: hypothetical protein JWO77_3063 [Ilumatobacteraceae bacterium]|nr:hypothetical protein [Ilumatobacteraceae bacterium]
MRAEEVEAALRRIGKVFIFGLILQPRISGQAVLLPLFGGLMIWALLGLDPVATSTEGRRGLRSTTAAAAVVTLLGIAGWLGAEPGGLSVFVLLASVTGVLLYAAFLQHWCMRYDWLEAAEHLRRSRVNLVGVSITTVLALGAVVAFADRPGLGRPEPDWWNLVVGRTVGDPWVIGFFVLVFIGWIGACIELERGAKAVRAKVAEHPDRPAPTA